MKNLIYTTVFLLSISVLAQDKPVNTIEKEEVRTMQVYQDGDMVDKKIQVITTKTQAYKTKKHPNHYENMLLVGTPIKIEKTIAVDDDGDNVFETEAMLTYYVSDDYEAIVEDENSKTGFQPDSNIEAKLTPDMNFIVYYHDADSGKIIKQTFKETIF